MILSFCIGKKVSWEKQIPIYEALHQTSILIFGLIGAWLAVLLPFALEKGKRLEHFFAFSKKLFPALSAAIYLLIITLVVPFSVSIVQNNFLFNEYINSVFCGISLSILAIGLLLLIWGLIMILSSFDVLKKEIELKEAASKLEEESKAPPKKSSSKHANR